MAANPEIQNRAWQELGEIFGDSDRPCTYNDTNEMKYLERCVMETLRLYPPAPYIGRIAKKEVTLRK